MDFLLLAAETAETREPYPISLSESLMVFLVGMAVVIAVLALLVGILYLFKYISKTGRSSKRIKSPVAAPPDGAMINSIAACDAEEETAAVISACVACILMNESEDGIVPPFVIKSVKRY